MPTKPNELDGTGLAMMEMLPKGRRESQDRYFDPAPYLTGPMTAPRDGDYIISVSLRSTGAPGDPPPLVGFVVDGKDVGSTNSSRSRNPRPPRPRSRSRPASTSSR